MEINEFEAGMLDAVLESFDSAGQLHREQILELFNGDEPLASAVVELLLATGLATSAGEVFPDGIPALLIRHANANQFLENGGFTAQLHQAKVANNSEPAAQQESALPVDAPVPNQTIEQEPETPAAQQKEIVFEVEVAKGDDVQDQPQPAFFPATEQIHKDELDVPDTADLDTPDLPEPDENDEPELEDTAGDIQERLDPVVVASTNKLKAISNQVPVTSSAMADFNHNLERDAEFEKLREEMFKLQREKILTENLLREKDRQVESLTQRNEQLANLRTFIWILIAVILILAIWIITHSK